MSVDMSRVGAAELGPAIAVWIGPWGELRNLVFSSLYDPGADQVRKLRFGLLLNGEEVRLEWSRRIFADEINDLEIR